MNEKRVIIDTHILSIFAKEADYLELLLEVEIEIFGKESSA